MGFFFFFFWVISAIHTSVRKVDYVHLFWVSLFSFLLDAVCVCSAWKLILRLEQKTCRAPFLFSVLIGFFLYFLCFSSHFKLGIFLLLSCLQDCNGICLLKLFSGSKSFIEMQHFWSSWEVLWQGFFLCSCLCQKAGSRIAP